MIRQILLGFVVPVAAGIAVLGIATSVARHPTRERGVQAGLGIALAGCVIAAFIAAEGLPRWPLGARWHWLPILTAAAAVVGVIASLAPKSFAILVLCAAATGSLAAWKMRLPGVDAMAWRAGLGVTVFVSTIVLAWLNRRQPSVTLPLDLAAVFAAMAALFLAVHFAKMAVLTGGVATLLGIAAAVALFESRVATGAAGVVVAGALIPNCALIGYSYDYATVGILGWSLVAATPAAMLAVSMLTRKWKSRAAKWLTRRGVVVALCSVAISLADFSDNLDY